MFKSYRLFYFWFLIISDKPEIILTDRMIALNGKVDEKSGKIIKYGFFNSTIELLCEATGNPLPTVEWYHNHNKKISHTMAPTFNGSSILTVF